ncbi:MAG: trimeric intracellular cation channel family protein [Bosea sp. (in: a-proteobacteria)]
MNVPPLIGLFEISGVAVFALTGALLAARRGLDPFGFAMLATVTGIGGGTLRDLLLDRPVFWIMAPRDLYICVGVSVLIFALGRLKPSLLARLERADLLQMADAAGLALFAVIGSLIASEAGAPWFVALALGAITASFGGILRDVIMQEPSLVVRSEIYVTAAALAAGVTLASVGAGAPRDLAMMAGFLAGFLLRLAAIWLGWSLPTSPKREK